MPRTSCTRILLSSKTRPPLRRERAHGWQQPKSPSAEKTGRKPPSEVELLPGAPHLILLGRLKSFRPPSGRAHGGNPLLEAMFGRHAVPRAPQKEGDAPELIDMAGLLAQKRPHRYCRMLAAPQTATAGLRGGRRPCGAQWRPRARSAQKSR